MQDDPQVTQASLHAEPALPGEAPASPPQGVVGGGAHDDCITPPINGFLRGVGYLYFLRFSLLLWLSLVAFVVLDWANVLTTATRGILTIESADGLRWAGFFVTLTGWIALLGARITTAYGEDRFNIKPPRWMAVGQDMTWGTFLLAQAPGLVMLWYLRRLSLADGQMKCGVSLPLIEGLLLALLLWTLLTVFSYWAYEPDWKLQQRGQMNRVRSKATRHDRVISTAFFAPIVNHDVLIQLENADPPALARGFTDLFQRLGRHAGPGFQKDACNPGSPLNAGHAIALILFFYLAFLYYVFFFYTAPVPLAKMRAWLLIPVCLGILTWFLAAIPYWKAVFERGWKHILSYSLGVIVVLLPVWLLLGYTFLLAWHQKPNTGFPVIASVYILLFSLCSGLSGLAFLFDRFRIPVLTTAIALLIPIHFVAGLEGVSKSAFGESQHILQTKPVDPVPLLYPENAVERFRKTHPPGVPMIVVTATGGGIHAASWTAQLLGELEAKFQGKVEANDNYAQWRQRPDVKAWYEKHPNSNLSFHDSILLLSTVSGGSVGVAEWIQAYRGGGGAGQGAGGPQFGNFVSRSGEPRTTAARRITECSSLEAVAWGLIYPDMLHVFLPFRLGDGLEKLDRSWALQTAIERNEPDGCVHYKADLKGKEPVRPDNVFGGTLAEFAQLLANGTYWVPAFSLNSTVAETGDRLILSNYRLPKPSGAQSEILPASSFLDVYCGLQDGSTSPKMPDLPVAAAARLSASFPYVSSMARVGRNVLPLAYHFGDGGYFDNDGTGTVIEFLRQAYFGQRDAPNDGSDPCHPKPAATTAASPGATRDTILLIEIRDGGNPLSDDLPDSRQNQDPETDERELRSGQRTLSSRQQAQIQADENKKQQKTPGGIWGPASQLGGPVQTFYHAGHESVTRRNRRELCILEHALQPGLSIEHYVFAYQQERPTVAQPLNWHLTALDKVEIQDNLLGTYYDAHRKLTSYHPATPTPELETEIAEHFADLLVPATTAGKIPGKTDGKIADAGGFRVPGECETEDNQRSDH